MLCLAGVIGAMAQSDMPMYYPGDGMYIVGIPGDMKPVATQPTIVVEAYQAKFDIRNTELASIKIADKTENITKYLDAEAGVLDFSKPMGIGAITSLKARDMEGNSYEFGQYNPNKQPGQTMMLAASCANLLGYKELPLGVYDHWDCPVSYAADPMLAEGTNDAVTVDFGNPKEGLVISGIDFPLVIGEGTDKSKSLTVTLSIYDKEKTTVDRTIKSDVSLATLRKVGEKEGNDVYRFTLTILPSQVLNSPFEITISGFSQQGVNAWIPRAVDTRGLYPSHTTYSASGKVESSDVCINVNGYFNYIGAWGWWDGKVERGECYASGDLVQIYYDPTDEDWPGDYYMGEAAFPVECTFGSSDIIIQEAPDWITNISFDDSQWEDYESVQLILTGAALPKDMSGRKDKVIFSTADGASWFIIFIRQGNAVFDGSETGIENARTIDLPAEGGMFDLNGRRITQPSTHYIYIKDGKKYIR